MQSSKTQIGDNNIIELFGPVFLVFPVPVLVHYHNLFLIKIFVSPNFETFVIYRVT